MRARGARAPSKWGHLQPVALNGVCPIAAARARYPGMPCQLGCRQDACRLRRDGREGGSSWASDFTYAQYTATPGGYGCRGNRGRIWLFVLMPLVSVSTTGDSVLRTRHLPTLNKNAGSRTRYVWMSDGHGPMPFRLQLDAALLRQVSGAPWPQLWVRNVEDQARRFCRNSSPLLTDDSTQAQLEGFGASTAFLHPTSIVDYVAVRIPCCASSFLPMSPWAAICTRKGALLTVVRFRDDEGSGWTHRVWLRTLGDISTLDARWKRRIGGAVAFGGGLSTAGQLSVWVGPETKQIVNLGSKQHRKSTFTASNAKWSWHRQSGTTVLTNSIEKLLILKSNSTKWPPTTPTPNHPTADPARPLARAQQHLYAPPRGHPFAPQRAGVSMATMLPSR